MAASTNEIVIKELLEHFVAPLLLLKNFPIEAPLQEQQLVAKQIYAVVMLFNYYHRKQFPGTKFLSFQEFSELAISLKPALKSHMKLLNFSDINISDSDDVDVDVDRAQTKVSITEMSIIDACDSCMHLNATKKVPDVEGWPVSGIAVLLVDSHNENCSLEIDGITQGCWSLIEKNFDDFIAKMQKKKSVMGASNVDESSCLKLALHAVKEARGINSNDLVVLESHNVYSLTTPRTSVRFYIMQYNQSLGEDIRLPIERVIESMQGPLVEQHPSTWLVTSVVEYFHVLPYADIITQWFSISRQVKVNKDKQEGVMIDPGSTKSAAPAVLDPVSDSSD